MEAGEVLSRPSFREYVLELERSEGEPLAVAGVAEEPFELPRFWRIARELVPAAWRPRIRALVKLPMRMTVSWRLTQAYMPVARRRAGRLLANHPEPKLHLGCGPMALDGWINIDLIGFDVDLYWDIGHALPFPDRCAAAVFHEHVLEHFSLPSAMSLLSECQRLLRPGGILRVGVPDFGLYARDYAGTSRLISKVRPRRPTPLVALSEVVYAYGHRSIWDGPSLVRLLEEIGFEQAAVREYGQSALEPAPDSRHRRFESLYVEAIKPGETRPSPAGRRAGRDSAGR
jgi:predicted SAM-dependent methyltransferase